MPTLTTDNSPQVLVIPYDPAERLDALEAISPAKVLDRWRLTDRSAHSPHIIAVLDRAGGDWIGAALVTARPHTAYLKIVDVVGDIPAVTDEVLAYARSLPMAQVKWEGWSTSAAPLAAGFTPLRPPSTGAGPQPATGYVRWMDDVEVSEPPYHQQTTHFTCGAVAALIAQTQAGVTGSEDIDRAAELTLWRAATNFPACEPVGLGVAVRRRWPATEVSVSLDATDPVILDFYPEDEQDWRAVLQHASREEANRLGVPIDGRRMSVAGIRDALAVGDHILLLVTLDAMLAIDVPHWVLCHGAVPGAVLIEDPWIDAGMGETWVDTHLLPIRDSALDEMSLMEAGRYRGAVRLTNPAAISGSR